MKEINKFIGELIITDKLTGEVVFKNNNLITTIGKNYLAENLNTQVAVLDRISIGSGTSTVLISDTTIETTSYTKSFDAKSFSANIFECEIDIAQADANGFWGNIGVLISDSRLFNHINIDYTKTLNQTLNLKFKFTSL
jgi:phosphosulfolactate synthase (CoM biosynthesis protein A)